MNDAFISQIFFFNLSFIINNYNRSLVIIIFQIIICFIIFGKIMKVDPFKKFQQL